MTTCSRCAAVKPLNAFGTFRSKGSTYRRRVCKECRRVESQNWRANTIAERREKDRQRYRGDPERMKSCKSRAKAWTQAHPESKRRTWEARRARFRGVEYEHVDREAIYARDGGRCHICGKRARRTDFHLDHLIPLSKGGPHVAANLRVAHPHCNKSRGAGRTPAQLLLVA